jgi:hypothetical protein
VHMSGGGCLGQRGFNFLVVALAPPDVTCEQQAPFAALVNGLIRMAVPASLWRSVTALLRAGHELTA